MAPRNFFIVGAPKCGTTALASYLSNHPHVCFSKWKEPHYFSTDFPAHRSCRTLESYRAQFGASSGGDDLRGEASVWYLYSKVAARNIHVYDETARIIAMVRDPMEMLLSLHAQMVYSFYEDETNLERAWALQERRAGGTNLPRGCRQPEFLQYQSVISLGEQVQRLFSIFPREQVKLILFDDFKQQPRSVYESVLSFLGLPDDGRTEFPIINQRRAHRSIRLGRRIQDAENRPARWLVKVDEWVSRFPVGGRLKITERALRANLRTGDYRLPCPAFETEVRRALAKDIDKLQRLIARDLRHWLAHDSNEQPTPATQS